ncbi:MAG: PAS domain-containing protein [Leptospirales bacterium]
MRVRYQPVLLPEEIEDLLMEIRLSGRLSLRSGKTSGHPLCEVRDRVRGFDDGFYLFDPKTLRILEANSLFCDMVGVFSQDVLVGKKITEFSPDTPDQILQMVREIRKRGVLEKNSVLSGCGGTSIISLSTEARIVPYEEGEAVLVVFRNTTP